MRTNDELIDEHLQTDPEFRAGWERTAFARTVAIDIVRAEHGLSQRELADRLAMTMAEIASIELGELRPTSDILRRISAGIGKEFNASR